MFSERKNVTINKVSIISGSEINKFWKNPMQIIETNIGIFIDNMKDEGIQGFPKGCDWKQFIGKQIENVGFIHSRNGIPYSYIKHPQKIKEWEINNISSIEGKIDNYVEGF